MRSVLCSAAIRILAVPILANALCGVAGSGAVVGDARLRVAVAAVRGAPELRNVVGEAISARADVVALDDGLVDAALGGAGYDGSINLTRADARRLGLVCGADVLVFPVASIAELEPVDGTRRWDGRLVLMVVDARSGALVRCRAIGDTGATRDAVTTRLATLVRTEVLEWSDAVAAIAARRTIQDDEGAGSSGEVLDLVANPEPGGDISPPRFFRRPRPVLTPDAERFRVIATVDVIVTFRADGTLGSMDVVRWAGFGLDEAVLDAIRSREFVPARRGRRPVDSRALLRFNFRYDEK